MFKITNKSDKKFINWSDIKVGDVFESNTCPGLYVKIDLVSFLGFSKDCHTISVSSYVNSGSLWKQNLFLSDKEITFKNT